MNRRQFFEAAALLTALPVVNEGSRVSVVGVPEWYQDTDTREDAVCAWGGDHVHQVRTALWSHSDPETAREELCIALALLDIELE